MKHIIVRIDRRYAMLQQNFVVQRISTVLQFLLPQSKPMYRSRT